MSFKSINGRTSGEKILHLILGIVFLSVISADEQAELGLRWSDTVVGYILKSIFIVHHNLSITLLLGSIA